MVQRSFKDRVKVFAVSVPLSPSLSRIQPWWGIKLVTHCSQQVIFILSIYYHEDQATLVLIHISTNQVQLFICHYKKTFIPYVPLKILLLLLGFWGKLIKTSVPCSYLAFGANLSIPQCHIDDNSKRDRKKHVCPYDYVAFTLYHLTKADFIT